MGTTTQVRVVVQARMTSTRLPGKSLLPIGGFPLTVLVLRRASSTGFETVLATSDEESDDELARVVERSGFRVFRGSRLDVLDRFLTATADLDDDDIAVRLTADNPVPDGDLIDAVVDDLSAGVDDYRYIDQRSVPYGLSVEAFRVRALRAAADSADADDREHVTSWIRRSRPAAPFLPTLPEGISDGLRCTVDVVEDYTAMEGIFAGRPMAGWRELTGDLR